MLTKSSARAVLLSLLVMGCAPTNPAIDVQSLLLPDPTMCVIGVDGAFPTQPTLDTNSASLAVTLGSAPGPNPLMRPFGLRYQANFLVLNRMINQFNGIYPIMADPNTFQVQGAIVELRDISGAPLDFGGALPNPYSVSGSGTISSALQDEAGRGIASVEILPRVYGDQFVDQDLTLLVSVQLTGSTTGGSEQSTGEFVFPLRLCNGCLFQCQMDMGVAIVQLSCDPGQDTRSLACF